MNKTLHALFLSATLLCSPIPSLAEESPATAAIEEYMDFAEYGSGIIWPEQIPEADWQKIMVIDARSTDQYEKFHIPGAVNIDWRKIPARRQDIPKDRMVLVYCNTGSLSAQSVFAMRVLGWDNVKVLQDGGALMLWISFGLRVRSMGGPRQPARPGQTVAWNGRSCGLCALAIQLVAPISPRRRLPA